MHFDVYNACLEAEMKEIVECVQDFFRNPESRKIGFLNEAELQHELGYWLRTKLTPKTLVYFERPASARPNSTSTIFVLEPDSQHAKRVSVTYGRMSGSQLEILSGLAPGDRVIVTDLPGVAGRDRVVLK